MESKELLYQIGISLIPGIGPVTAKKLIAFCGNAEAVFREKQRNLLRIPGIGPVLSESIAENNVLQKAENEIRFNERFQIQALYFEDGDYPDRLKQCVDGPVILFYKGMADLNAGKVVSIVGTRNASPYGKEVCRELIGGLVNDKVLVISGLAYGIDTYSHRFALESGLFTVGVLGHGLDRIYPPSNRQLAEKMLKRGGLITDFSSGTKPDRENFPRRNRIIAGMADATVVVEAAAEGGALITADIASSYNRDVFAIPGRWTDKYSFGCNYLIRSNKAALIQSAEDLRFFLGWKEDAAAGKRISTPLLINLSPDEELIVRIVQENSETSIDHLSLASGLNSGYLAKALLSLELQGILQCLPGKRYKLAR